jgi:ribosome-binding protein aMBF1 (putative translation factor)
LIYSAGFAERCTDIPVGDRRGIRRDIHAILNYNQNQSVVIHLRISKYPSNTYGERIKKWRLEQGIIQKDLAKLIGVDEMTINNWERGKTKPAQVNLKKIEEILDLTT